MRNTIKEKGEEECENGREITKFSVELWCKTVEEINPHILGVKSVDKIKGYYRYSRGYWEGRKRETYRGIDWLDSRKVIGNVNVIISA